MDKVYEAWARDYRRTTDLEKQQYCSICLEDFEVGEEIIELRCDSKHIFHLDCIKGWAKKNKTCPLCRSDI